MLTNGLYASPATKSSGLNYVPKLFYEARKLSLQRFFVARRSSRRISSLPGGLPVIALKRSMSFIRLIFHQKRRSANLTALYKQRCALNLAAQATQRAVSRRTVTLGPQVRRRTLSNSRHPVLGARPNCLCDFDPLLRPCAIRRFLVAGTETQLRK